MTTEPTAATENTADDFTTIGTATYSVEDNKLRLYAFARLSQADYDRVKAAGFKWAPKQELFVAPAWTPSREDLLLELCGEVEDEDYSALERAADRAERFSGYRDKRTAEAVGHADTFDAGPQAFGHQNAARAARLARRHDRHRGRACSQWAKAEYWQSRTEGVIANALHRADPHTRRGRIKTLEAEQRRYGNTPRWKEHFENRLMYERAMLAVEGGTAAEVEMIPGGWIRTGNRTGSVFTNVSVGWKQIHAVTRSTVTKKVTSVKVMGLVGVSNPKPGLVSVNIERLGEENYRAPTAEELEAFTAQVAAAKKAKKETTPKGPELINPTIEEAQKLQDILNATAKASYDEKPRYEAFTPSTIICMTQKQYSERSKGSSPACQTGEISEQLRFRRYEKGGRVTVFKVRYANASGFNFYAAPRIIVITDKPQKAFPWELVEEMKASQPTADKMFHLLGEIEKEMASFTVCNFSQTLLDAAYVGFVSLISLSQKRWTEKGQEALKKYKEVLADGGTPIPTGIIYSKPPVEAEEPAPAIVNGEALLFA